MFVISRRNEKCCPDHNALPKDPADRHQVAEIDKKSAPVRELVFQADSLKSRSLGVGSIALRGQNETNTKSCLSRLPSPYDTSIVRNCTHLVMASLCERIDTLLARKAFRNATVCIQVRDFLSGKTIYSRNSETSIPPASNQKLVTAAAALSRLGHDFKYQTTAKATSRPDSEGIIHGDLWLKGSGDPSLTSTGLATLARDLVGRGVREITGDIVGDGSIFDDNVLGEGWAWDNEPFAYSAQVSGLNCDGNVVRLSVSPGLSEGDNATVRTTGSGLEEEDYTSVVCTAKTVKRQGKHSLCFGRRRGFNHITVQGNIPLDSDPIIESITIEDPVLFTASRFANCLKAAGIKCSGSLRKATQPCPDAITLGMTFSDRLAKILMKFLKESDNMYGEAILKSIGHYSDLRTPGSAKSGLAFAKNFLEHLGVSTDGLVMVDGSGLSRLNALTARSICDLLTSANLKLPQDAWNVYLNALPVGGVDGTLAKRFQDEPLKGRVRAKTGSLSSVSSLSGYILDDFGEVQYIFSILMSSVANMDEARQTQEDIVAAIFNTSP